MATPFYLQYLVDIKTLLSNSSTFQTMCTKTSPATVAPFIFIYETDTPTSTAFAVVTDPEEESEFTKKIQAQGFQAYAGYRSAQIVIYQYVSAWNETNSSTFLTRIDDILGQMLALQGTQSYAIIDSFSKVNARTLPYRFIDAEQKGYQLGLVFRNRTFA